MPTQYTRRALIIIKASDLVSSRVDTKLIDTAGGEKCFGKPLCPVSQGIPPATHYACSWACTEAEYNALSLKFGDSNGLRQSRMWDGNTKTLQQAMAEMSLRFLPSTPPGT